MAGKKKPVRRAPSAMKAAPKAVPDTTASPTAVSAMLEASAESSRGANNFDLLRLAAAASVVFGHCFLVLGDEPPLLNADSFADWGNWEC